MGFDRRLIHPKTVVNDAPTRFGSYQPENFLRVYHGEVSIETALQQSLNVPAVAVLDGVGPARFAAQLKRAGVDYRYETQDGRPGLAIALGGGGISLFDLVALYRGLAAGGQVQPLSLRAGAEVLGAARLMSPMAAWYLTRILEAAPPPDALVAAQATRRPHPIAYKTGTSYGFRDAWAVGYDGGYTVGVWVGRADGTPSPGHYGRRTAAPILYRVFDLLPGSRSGAAGVANPSMPDEAIEARRTEDLPANLRRYGAGVSLFRTVKATAAADRPLEITFPPNGSTVALEKGAGGHAALPLTAAGGRKPLRWLVNGRPVASDDYRRQGAWRPDGPGFVRITVVDAEGRTASSIARLQ
jgi:penicillin-binding protein 1C